MSQDKVNRGERRGWLSPAKRSIFFALAVSEEPVERILHLDDWRARQ